MNGDQVRDLWFCRVVKTGVAGYHPLPVDNLRRRIAAELDAGRSARPLIQDASFAKPKSGLRYDIDAVDWFLDQFLLPPGHVEPGEIADDPWANLPVARVARAASEKYAFELQCDRAWREFDLAPGTRLRFGKAARGLTELRTAEQQTLASARGIWRKTFSAGGKTFTLQRAGGGESSSAAIAELQVRAARVEAGHYAEDTYARIRTFLGVESGKRVLALADGTGTDVLYTAGDHYNWRAGACIVFPDQRWLRFLVRGSVLANAIMTALDQEGNSVARYRCTDKSGRRKKSWSQSSVEIVVHPGQKLTDELALTLALSADWLRCYFIEPTGGA